MTCGSCRTPLRAVLVTRAGLAASNGELSVGHDEYDFVECENCGSDIGTLDAVQTEFAELSRR